MTRRVRLAFSAAILACTAVAVDVTAQTTTPASPSGMSGPPVPSRALIKARLSQSIATADLNRDGLLDIVTTDFLTDSVKILIAKTGGGFQSAVSVSVGRGPRAVVAADFDQDGSLDLAVGEFLGGSVRVLKGQGDGTFATGDAQQLGAGVSSIAAGDFDGDGLVDLAAANAMTGRIVLLGNVSGTLSPTTLGRGKTPTLLVPLDVNGDDVSDVVAVEADGQGARAFTSAGGTSAALDTDVPWVLTQVERAGKGLTAAGVRSRLAKPAGDGQVNATGSSAAEPLILDVHDGSGAPTAGATVLFSRISGSAAISEPGKAEEVGMTDESGRVGITLLVPDLPDASVISATLDGDQIEHFGVVATVDNEQVVQALATALAGMPEASAYGPLLESLLQQLGEGDVAGSLTGLSAILDTLPLDQQGSGPTIVTSKAAELSKRFISQILTIGVYTKAVDTDALVCDVTLIRTIATTTEVDALTLAGVAGEKVHVTIGNEGGVAFTPVWRMLAPGGAPVSGCGAFTTLGLDCTLPSTGTYTVEVRDNGQDATGTYSIHVQRLTDTRRCGGSIACDTPVSSTLGASGRADTNLHSFTSVAGERVHVVLANQGGTSFFPLWRMVAPDGSVVSGCGAFTASGLDCTLPTAGSYAIEVIDSAVDGSGTYGLLVQRLTAGQRCGGAITCDVPASQTLGVGNTADTNLHSFTSVAGERVHVVLANQGGTSFQPLWRMVAPDGSVVSGCGAFTSSGLDCTLPTAGSYAIEVIDSAVDGAGTYGLLIQRLTAGQRCGGAITCDVPTSQTLGMGNPADTNLHSFNGVAGERLYVALSNQGGTSFLPLWRMVAPDGSVVSGCGAFTASALDCTLPTAGSYAIEVIDSAVDGSGTYGLHIQRLTAGKRCDGPIPCGTPLTTSLGMVNEADTNLHSFNTATGTVDVTFTNLGGTSFNPFWRLILPDGSPAASCGTFFASSRTCSIAVAGSHAIHVVDGSLDGSGSYQLTVSCPDGTADLVISGLSAPAKACAGASITIKPKTANIGTGASGPTTTKLFFSTNNVLDGGDVQLGPDIAVAGLAPGAFKQNSQNVAVPATAPGKKFIIAVADAGGSEGESNEGNNTRSKRITIGPDLVVTKIEAPSSATPGSTISVSVTTKNQGGCGVVATITRLYFSINNSVDGGDPFQEIAVSALAANGTQTNVVSVTIPAGTPVGNRFLIAVADAGGVVTESSEANTKKTTIEVQ